MISHCSSVRNYGLGFQILAGSRVADCTATDNESDDYFLSEGSTAEGCTAKDNKGDGIRATTRCLILNNLSDGNPGGSGVNTTDLQAVTLPTSVTTDVSYHYIINQPGSYYLSANLDVSKPNGIQINAEAVTLDLNGFETARASGSSGNGIEIAAASHRASVRNGSIKGFAYGVRSILSGGFARGCSFSDLVVSECTNTGIFAGEGSVLQACRAHDNSGSGIYADFGSSVANCSAHNNTGFAAIITNAGSTVTNCAAYNNTGTYGILANGGSSLTTCTAFLNTVTYGIFANVGSSLTNCTAYSNTSSSTTSASIRASSGSTIAHCTANFNISTAATFTPTSGMGFYVGSGSTIQGGTAYSNQGDGINVFSDTVVRNNTCDSNAVTGPAFMPPAPTTGSMATT